MARIAGINIPTHKHTVIALRAIYGVGSTRAQQICAAAGVAPNKKVRDLDDNELDALRGEVGKYDVEGDLHRLDLLKIRRLLFERRWSLPAPGHLLQFAPHSFWS